MYFKFHTFAISPIANGYSGNLFFIPMSLAVLWLRHMRPVSLWVIWMRQNKTKWTLKYREENNTAKKSHHKSNMFSFSSWTFFNACSKHVPHHHPVPLPHTPPVGRNGRSGCASLINYYGLVFLPVCIAAVPFFSQFLLHTSPCFPLGRVYVVLIFRFHFPSQCSSREAGGGRSSGVTLLFFLVSVCRDCPAAKMLQALEKIRASNATWSCFPFFCNVKTQGALMKALDLLFVFRSVSHWVGRSVRLIARDTSQHCCIVLFFCLYVCLTWGYLSSFSALLRMFCTGDEAEEQLSVLYRIV